MDNNFIYASITGKIVGASLPKTGAYYTENEKVFELQSVENEFQVSIALEEINSAQYKIGVPATVQFKNDNKSLGQIQAKTIAVLRKQNGKLESVLELQGNMKENAEIIFNSGYLGEAEQRLPASITTGQKTVWSSINGIVKRALWKEIL